MLRYTVRRLLLLIPILLGLSLLVFFWVRNLPGGPAEALLGERATPETVAQIERQYGLDQPLPVQYWRYLKNIVHGEFGDSTKTRRPVSRSSGSGSPRRSSSRSRPGLFALIFGVPFGFIAAKHYQGPADHASLIVTLIGISTPIFFLALILKYVFAVRLGWLPSVGRISVLIDLDHPTNFYVLDAIIAGNWNAFVDTIKHLILPAIALASIPLAIIARVTRASVLDVQNEDYVRTARAKGVSPMTVNQRHVLRNAMLPIVDDHRPPGRPPPLGRRAHGDRLRVPRHRILARRGDQVARLPRHPGRPPLRRRDRRLRQSLRRPLLRRPQPADPAEQVRSR